MIISMITMIKQLVAVSLHQSPSSPPALRGLGDLQQASALCGILAALAPSKSLEDYGKLW